MKPIPGFTDYGITEDGRVYRYAITIHTTNGHVRYLSEREKRTHLDRRGYVRTSLKGSSRLVHRFVALAYIPNPNEFPYVDHIDGNPANNNIGNLRWVTQQTNQFNRHKLVAASGATGVHRIKTSDKNMWRAAGKLNGRHIHLGVFSTLEAAIVARHMWEKEVGCTTSNNIKKRNNRAQANARH